MSFKPPPLSSLPFGCEAAASLQRFRIRTSSVTAATASCQTCRQQQPTVLRTRLDYLFSNAARWTTTDSTVSTLLSAWLNFTFRQWAVCDGGDNQAHVASLILCFSSSRDASDRFYDASGSPSLTSEFLWFSLEFVAFLVLCCGTAVDARFYRFIYKILFVFRVCGERCKGRNHSQPISLCALLCQFAIKSSMRHVARIDAPRRMNRCATSH